MFAARALLMFPYVTSMVAVSMVWLYLFEPTNGILNKLLEAMGIPGKKWLFDEKLALPCLIAVNIWKNVGYVMIIFLAGLAAIPKELYEAGRVDGAGDFRMLFSITIPCIRPVTVFVVTTMCIEAFKTFDQVNIMTNGGPELDDYSGASNLCPCIYRVPDGLRIGNVGGTAYCCLFDYIR